ncbi:MAG: hypothetical protein PF488_01100 [Patescibacteria group bacterium]|jgi:hypothetical protein|nr:hypothetical protein [Patescibacteria group bacterium]
MGSTERTEEIKDIKRNIENGIRRGNLSFGFSGAIKKKLNNCLRINAIKRIRAIKSTRGRVNEAKNKSKPITGSVKAKRYSPIFGLIKNSPKSITDVIKIIVLIF